MAFHTRVHDYPCVLRCENTGQCAKSRMNQQRKLTKEVFSRGKTVLPCYLEPHPNAFPYLHEDMGTVQRTEVVRKAHTKVEPAFFSFPL